jgi:iron complex transport system substrate-binding protein
MTPGITHRMLKKYLFYGAIAGILYFPFLVFGQAENGHTIQPPLKMPDLKKALSYARGQDGSNQSWPRVIAYDYEVYDFRRDSRIRHKKKLTMDRKPLRIIPHGVGVSEILWAICPRERIIAYNELSANPKYCFIADQVKQRYPVYTSKQTERIIGYQPDLIFTVFFSEVGFKNKLEKAGIPYLDLGHFGTIESIKKQVLTIGEIIGEEDNAAELVRIMDLKMQAIQAKIPVTDRPKQILFYDVGGYVPGKISNFNSICRMIRVVNVGSREGIASWRRIDDETLLKWDPEIIIVPAGNHLKEQLKARRILAHARAVKNNKIYSVPNVYLTAGSQYMILSANLLAGIVYENAF